jgi:hypothetical protein
MKFQLWSIDEYGTSSIMSESSENISDVVAEAVTILNAENVTNPLTAEEKKRNFTHFMVRLVDEDGELIENAVYAGPGPSGIDMVQQTDENVPAIKLSSVEGGVRIFLGELDGNDWLLDDEWKKPVDSLSHALTADKTVLFIKKV